MTQQGACPNGAIPTSNCATGSIYIRLALLGASIVEWLDGFWPAAAASDVMAIMGPDDLCATNMLDPGNPTLDMLKADLTAVMLPGFNSQSGTLGWWLFQKAMYAAFSSCCVCRDTATPPPAPITIVLPPNTVVYPPGPDEQPQLTRIEDNQAVSSDGLLNLYNGLQYTHSYAANSWFRTAPKVVETYGHGAGFPMSGEGSYALQPFVAGSNTTYQDPFGILVKVTTIPPTVAQRGSVTPRLYGVGSVMWDSSSSLANGKVITQRDSIHYQTQFITAPQLSSNYTLWWRLMPGVAATGFQVFRAIMDPFYSLDGPSNDALVNFHGIQLPPNWSDPPFYPRPAARRVFALGSPP